MSPQIEQGTIWQAIQPNAKPHMVVIMKIEPMPAAHTDYINFATYSIQPNRIGIKFYVMFEAQFLSTYKPLNITHAEIKAQRPPHAPRSGRPRKTPQDNSFTTEQLNYIVQQFTQALINNRNQKP